MHAARAEYIKSVAGSSGSPADQISSGPQAEFDQIKANSRPGSLQIILAAANKVAWTGGFGMVV